MWVKGSSVEKMAPLGSGLKESTCTTEFQSLRAGHDKTTGLDIINTMSH